MVITVLTIAIFKKSSLEDIFSLLLERKEGRERNIGAREKHRLAASKCARTGDRARLDPDQGWGIEPAIWNVTGNRTCNLLITR